MPSTLALPGLRPLLVAQVGSSFAMSVLGMATVWLVLEQHGTATQVSVVASADLLAAVLLGLPLGARVDRVGARRWMIGSDVLAATLALTISVLAAAHALPFPLLVALVLAIGALTTPYLGSQQTVLAEVVGEDRPDRLAAATSLMQGASRTATMLGAPLSGLLVAGVGATTTLLATVASLLVVALVVWRLVPSPRHGGDHAGRPEPARLLDGVRQLAADPLLRRWVAGSALTEIAYQALFVAIPVLVVIRYHADAATAGLLMGCFGAGALAGSVAASAITERIRPARMAVLSRLAQALAGATLIVPGPTAAAAASLLALGLTNGLGNGPAGAVQVARLPAARRGGALTASFTLVMGASTLGALGAGPVLEHLSGTVLFVALTALLVMAWVLFRSGARWAGDVPSRSSRVSDRPSRPAASSGASPAAEPAAARPHPGPSGRRPTRRSRRSG